MDDKRVKMVMIHDGGTFLSSCQTGFVIVSRPFKAPFTRNRFEFHT